MTNNLEQLSFLCEAPEKVSLLTAILLDTKPTNSVIFCNNRECVEFVKSYLGKSGFYPRASRGPGRRITVTGDEFLRKRKHPSTYDCVINFDVPYTVRNYSARMALLDTSNKNRRCITFFCDFYSDYAQPIVDEFQLCCQWPSYDLGDYQLPNRKQVQDWLASDRRQQRKKPSPQTSVDSTKRSSSSNDYVRRKTDAIVATSVKKQSFWERLLSFVARK